MAQDSTIIENASRFVSGLLKEKTPEWAMYHNFDHTDSVVRQAEEIGTEIHLSRPEMDIVTLAAWFHDTGRVSTQIEHEAESAKIATDFLQEHGYPREKIDQVVGCILATKFPHDPQNRMQEVLSDADTLHLGKKKFSEKNNLFRMELERQKGSPIPETEWLNTTIDFMSKHQFHTKYAMTEYNPRKSKHLLALQDELREVMKEQTAREAKAQQKKDKLVKDEKQPVRGIETMIRLMAGNHIHFSSIADHKASMLISTNSLMMTLVVTLVGRGLFEKDPKTFAALLPVYIVVPIIVLMVSAIVTIIFAVISTIPKITSGTFTREDIKQKKANLLFFGNFYKMSAEDFLWGTKEIMKDKDYMYTMMIEDVYYLGRVLGKKFRYLRISYNVFMFGLITTLITFALMYIFLA